MNDNDQSQEDNIEDSNDISLIQKLTEENEKLKKDLEEKNNKYLLSLAEAENSRKRMQKERQELTKYAVENVLVDFLIPIENMEKALSFKDNMSSEVKDWAIGFSMLLEQLKQIFSDHGVTPYSSIGQMFDPHLHEAVETEETEQYAPGIILEEFAKGYKVGERPIRVARVKVAKLPSKEYKNKNVN